MGVPAVWRLNTTVCAHCHVTRLVFACCLQQPEAKGPENMRDTDALSFEAKRHMLGATGQRVTTPFPPSFSLFAFPKSLVVDVVSAVSIH